MSIKQIGKGLYEIAESERYPKGGIKVVVTVWQGGKKEKTLSYADYPTKSECRDVADRIRLELKTALKNAILPAASSLKVPTVEALLEYYKSRPKANGDMRNLHGQRGVYNRLIEHMGTRLASEAPAALDTLVEHLTHDLKFKAGTANRHIAMLKAACKEAHRRRTPTGERWIAHNYLADYQAKPEKNIRYRMLSDSERLQLWNKMPDSLRRVYLFALLVPVRASELVNLTRDNLNEMSGFISIPRTKGGFARTIKIPDPFIPVFRNLNPKATHLFHDDQFRPMGYWSTERERLQFKMTHEFAAICKDCGIEGYNFHKTRQEAVMKMWATKKPDGTWYSIDEIMLIGGWKTEAAFSHYFNREVALQVRMGAYQLSNSWESQFVADLLRQAA